jgi:hypothetical protein
VQSVRIRISRICFSKEKPVEQVHESVDHAGPVHRGPAAIAALGSTPELGLRPLQCPRAPTKGWGGEGRAGEFDDGVAAVREAVEGHLTSGGAPAQKGGGEGTLRAKRRSVGVVGVFTEGGATFYRVEVRRGRPDAFNGRRQKSFNATGLKAPVTGD